MFRSCLRRGSLLGGLLSRALAPLGLAERKQFAWVCVGEMIEGDGGGGSEVARVGAPKSLRAAHQAHAGKRGASSDGKPRSDPLDLWPNEELILSAQLFVALSITATGCPRLDPCPAYKIHIVDTTSQHRRHDYPREGCVQDTSSTHGVGGNLHLGYFAKTSSR